MQTKIINEIVTHKDGTRTVSSREVENEEKPSSIPSAETGNVALKATPPRKSLSSCDDCAVGNYPCVSGHNSDPDRITTYERPETCEDRDYRCCEALTSDGHTRQFGYPSASDAVDLVEGKAMTTDNDVEVALMYLPRGEYNNLVFVEGGKPLTEQFPDHLFVLGTKDMGTILEVAGEMTPHMRELFPNWPNPEPEAKP